MGGDKQFHVGKDQMKTVKARWSRIKAGQIIKIKWRRGVDLRFTRQRLNALPSVGLMASGKVSHGRVHVGQG